MTTRLPLIVGLILVSACASLGQLGMLVQAPKFDEADDRPAELRLLPPSAQQPLGGAGVRLWATVSNPNPFGFTLATLDGTLILENTRAASVEFPLGLPLSAGASTTIPIDISFGFAELPRLADVVRRAARNEPVGYELEGTIGVDAGRLGTPVFGPTLLLRGTLE
jgi:hypothetical protein